MRVAGYIREGTQSVSWKTGGITPLPTMLLRVCLICSQYSMDTFCQVCWTGVMVRSVLIKYVPDMLPIVSKESGKACFKVMMSLTISVEVGIVTSADLDLRDQNYVTKPTIKPNFSIFFLKFN